MRTVLPLLLGLAGSLAVTSPALAQARVEARGGVIWDGKTEATAGVAAGIDAPRGPGAFVGGEVSADKVLTHDTKVGFGFTGRIGAQVGPASKLYADGGYTTEFCDACDGSWHAGAGYEHGFGGRTYGKLGYRHYFADHAKDSNAVTAGVGVRF